MGGAWASGARPCSIPPLPCPPAPLGRLRGDPDLCALAAAYAFGIARNYPFVDGNKRTAFLVTYVFLARNGRRLTAPESAATWSMIALAAGDLDEARLAQWLRDNTQAHE
jgi:death on curing protein